MLQCSFSFVPEKAFLAFVVFSLACALYIYKTVSKEMAWKS
jgi:hypothetical protein